MTVHVRKSNHGMKQSINQSIKASKTTKSNPLSLSDCFSLAHPAARRCSATKCGAVAAADKTRMVALPWHSVPRPDSELRSRKCPCAGSLALKALIEAEVSYYTLTSFASSRGHESPGYPAWQIASARCVWLACLAVVVCLRPKRGPTVVLLGKSSTTKSLSLGPNFKKNSRNFNLN